jgi:hypothetical protein
MTLNPWVRPYVLTGGRTRTKHNLYVHTLVVVDRYDAAAALKLSPEARRLYERALFGAQSDPGAPRRPCRERVRGDQR